MSFLVASGHVEVEARTDKAKSQITALIGAMGALGPVAGAAGAAMASAGAGVTAFSVAAGKQVAQLKKASEAQSKYQDAVDKSGRGSQDAAKAQLEYQRTLAKMPKATQEAAVAFQSLKDSYDEWSDSLADSTMPVFTKSFAVFQALLPKTSGLVRGTSAELDRLVTLIAGGVASPGFDRFMGKLEDFSAATLHSMTNGLIDLSRSLGGFAVAGGFDQFIDTAKEVGPLLGETLANLAKAMLNVAAAGEGVGVTLLTAANALAELVNAVPPEVLGSILQLYAGLKLLKLGIAGVTAVTSASAVANLTAFVRAARFGGVGSALSGVAQRMTLLQKAGASLGVLGVAAFAINELAENARGAPPDVDRLTASLKTLAASGRWSGELKATFGDMDGFVAKLGQLRAESETLKRAQPILDFSSLGGFADTAVEKIDDLVRGSKSLGATKDDFKAFDETFAAMAQNGYADQAAQQFRAFKEAALAGGMSLKDFNAAFPQYRDVAAGLKSEAQLAAQGMGIFGQQAQETSRKLNAQKTAADGLRQALLNLNDVNRAAYDSQIAFEQGIDALTASFKEHGATLDIDTAAGQANGAAMSAAAKGHDEMLVASIAAGDSMASMTGESERLRSEMMRLATQAFGGNTKAAEEYVNKLLGTPKDIKTMIKLERQEAVTGLQAVQAAIKATPGAKSVKVDTLNAAAIKALEEVGYKTRTLEDGRTEVYTANGQSLGSIGAVDKALNNLNGKTANTYTNHHVRTYHYAISSGQVSGRTSKQMGRARGGRVRGYAAGGDVQAYPVGGYVQGPGSGTSDSILAMLGSGAMARISNTEFIVNARSTAKHLPLLEMINADRLPRFAKGGLSESAKQARKDLGSDVTLSTAGKLAGYRNTETVHDLGMPDSVSSLVSSINSYLSNIKKAFSGKTESALVSQMTKSGKALLDNQKRLEGVNKALEAAKGTLEDLKGKFDSLKTSVSSSLVSFGNITKIGKYGTSPETLIKQLQSDTGRTTEFAQQLEALKGKGLNAEAIGQIAQAGITGGGMATAQSLLNATPEQIARINELQAQLQKSADAAGTTTADAMYGAGVRAAEGLVKGLTAQQKAIEAAMMSIAKAMEASIKKALGIKSPSKLMEPIGDFAMQGVEAGWQGRMAKGRTLLSGSTAGLRVRPALMPPAGAAPTAAAGPVNITVHVHSTDLMSNRAEQRRVAVTLAKEMNDALLDFQKQRRR
jgi:hypothetical protein